MSMRFDSSSLRVLCISAFLVTFVATSYAGVQVTASGGNVRDSGGAIIGTFTTSSGGAVFTFSDLNGNTSDWDWSGYTNCYWHALTHDYYLIVEAVRDPDTGDLLGYTWEKWKWRRRLPTDELISSGTLTDLL